MIETIIGGAMIVLLLVTSFYLGRQTSIFARFMGHRLPRFDDRPSTGIPAPRGRTSPTDPPPPDPPKDPYL